MRQTLLATKTYVPSTQNNLVRRSRLLDKLGSSFQPQNRLSLISAPAGSGKSTLLADWAASLDVPAAWLSLDEDDNDLYRFWVYLLFAIQTRFPGAGQNLLDELRSPQPLPMDEFLPALINTLAEIPSSLLLVIDDYHVIQSSLIHESLTFFLEHLPLNFRLVIATRLDPPLPIHRWRARGQLIEIRSADLRFNAEECEIFLKDAMGLNLRSDEIRQLGERTEGWAVGLHLAGLSLQGRANSANFIQRFSGSHHFVLEYLTNEVLVRQPPEVQEFLLKTSILDQLCEPLCRAVTGREDAAQLLDHLMKHNLFVISLDDEHYWYRYHHLFSQLLRVKLAARGEAEVFHLHQSAARWYSENDFIHESLSHALQAKDDNFAADLVNRNWRQAIHTGRLKEALKWLESLPDEKVMQSALLCAGFAWALWLNGRNSQVEKYVEQAIKNYSILESEGKVPQDNYEYTTLPGQMAALQALTANRRGDLDQAIQSADQAIALSPPKEALARGLAFSALGYAYREIGDFDKALEVYQQSLPCSTAAGNAMAVSAVVASMSRIYLVQGKFHLAEENYRKALAEAESRGSAQLPVYGMYPMGLAELAYERNDLPRAEALLEQGLEQGRRGGYTDLIKNGAVLQARLKRAEGDLRGGLAVLEAAAPRLLQSESFLLYREVQALAARLYAEVGEREQAERWLNSLQIQLDRYPGLTQGIELMNAAWVLAGLGRWSEAAELLARIENAARQGGSRGREREALVLHALVLSYQQQPDEAMDCLIKSMEPEIESCCRVYLDAGQPVIALLKNLSRASGEPYGQQAARLLKILGEAAGEAAGKAACENVSSVSAQAGQNRSLSDREIQVLELLAAGLSNAEIAERLVVSFATIKTHVSHIYDKLDVQNRAEAVTRAKEQNIL